MVAIFILPKIAHTAASNYIRMNVLTFYSLSDGRERAGRKIYGTDDKKRRLNFDDKSTSNSICEL